MLIEDAAIVKPFGLLAGGFEMRRVRLGDDVTLAKVWQRAFVGLLGGLLGGLPWHYCSAAAWGCLSPC